MHDATTNIIADARPWQGRWLAGVLAAIAVLFVLFADPFLAPPDCASYWSWGSTLARDLDLDFSNQFAAAAMPRFYVYLTETDRLANDWPMGTGLALGPWVLAGPIIAHGWMLACVALACLAWWRVERCLDARSKAVALMAAVAGTPLLFYGFFGPFFSHPASFAATTVFLVFWAATRDGRSLAEWLLLGLLLGFAGLMRPQNFLLVIVCAAELPRLLAQGAPVVGRAILAGFAGTLLGFSPQMAAYNVLYGSPFAFPKSEEMHWVSPAIIQTLFSDFHGVLPWTPVYALVVVGLVALWRRDRVLASGLAMALGLQVYINAANLVWWSGGSFGNRRLGDSAIIVAWALGALISQAPSTRRRAVVVSVAGACCAWTMLLVLAERRLIVPLDRYIPFTTAAFWSSLPAVVTEPVATWRAAARPMLDGDDLVLRILGGLTFVAAVAGGAVVLGRVRRSHGARLLGGLGAAGVLMLVLVVAAGIRTRPIEDPTILASVRREPGILWDNYVELAYYELMNGDFAAAERTASRAAAMRPEHQSGWWYLANALYFQERFREAAEAAQRVLEVNPGHVPAASLLAEATRRAGAAP